MKTLATLTICCFVAACAVPSQQGSASSAAAAPATNMILVRQTSKTPDQLVEAIKAYVEGQKWVYLGANKVKNGEITIVKVCVPAVGAMVWGAGLEYSALLPCGNLSVYQKAGRTEVAMIDPRYMGALAPRAETKQAGEMAHPLLVQMLDTAAR